MIEFGILLPVFVLFAFGIVEFGLALTNFNAVRNGAREGARSAVVAEFGDDTSCPIQGGGAASAETKGLVCLTKARVDLDEKATGVKVDWPADYKPGDPIVVCVSYPLDAITGMFDPVLAGRSLRRLQPQQRRPPVLELLDRDR
jgi:Flp pilus assembly protein TadG